MKFTKNPKYSYFSLSNCIRILTADSVEKARSGHPGMPLGMADVMTALVFNFLKFNPKDPSWFNRDRLILSNGHGSMLLYAFYYLTQFNDFTLEDLKNFRQLGSKTPGHPEYGAYSAIETTTGPLGQGFATSVGMAIAAKKYQQKLGSEICNYKIYCTVGDGCLMEGISYEAASLAGHLGLNNLIVLFDDNKISIDGSTDLTVSEDHLKKFLALGWNVAEIDGHDFEQINAALEVAQTSSKPSFIACKTQIGKGAPNKIGTAEAHGAPLGADEIDLLRQNLNHQGESFFIPQELLDIWREAGQRNEYIYDQWFEEFNKLSPDAKSYLRLPEFDLKFLREVPLIKFEEATRVSSGRILEKLLENSQKIICGSADLSLSNNLKSKSNQVITKDDFGGNYIHYGVRENAMAAIMNGLSLSGFLSIGGSFFIFTDYMKPSIRLAALMHRQVIYVMTHDSIGVGEDGPTHQPIEQLAALRAMPNLKVFRPADLIETLECWECALKNTNGPSMLVLTRQNVPQVRNKVVDKNLSSYGAYEIIEDSSSPILHADITIFASGSELSIAIDTARILKEISFKVRVISIPCFELFFQQDREYIDNILKGSKLKVAIEAASSFGWHRIIEEDGLFFGVEEFGRSAPAKILYEYFGLTAKNIAEKIKERIR